jgi:hypothetical protein
MTRNLLARETSPYLLQHKDNPVHWRPWNDDTLAEARRAGKPILLSVGYAACHWCHVMAHESFENAEIAGVMNELFVNVKVDREERPDLDAVYQSALAMMGEHGGWPLTMFLTSEGEPFWGGTYFPATARYGRPAFTDVLKSVAEAFKDKSDSVMQNVAALRDGLKKLATPEGGGELSIAALGQTATAALHMVDPIRGGTEGAPKFPQPSFFQFLWQAYRRTGSPMFREAVTVTLDNICQGGIYDHLGGGFARYSTDAEWLAPHFEKMLYDNALLIELLTDAWQDTGNPLYRARVRETIEWAFRDMRSAESGPYGFVSAFDADSEGEEGKYYVWTEAEIDDLLGKNARLFKLTYDVSPGGNWEGHAILNRSAGLKLGDDEFEEGLRQSRAKLLTVRASRVPPQRDDKVLADWNGLMIAALAKAGAVFGEPAWIAAARGVFAFVVDAMTVDGRLMHTWCAGRPRHPAVVDDYANMARAALVLAGVTGDDGYREQAGAWAKIADAHYWDAAGNGYFLAADDTRDVIARSKTIHDNAVPAGNGTMAEVLARLWHLTGDAAYRDRFDQLVHAVAAKEPRMLMHQPTLLNAFELMATGQQVVIVGDAADAATKALVGAVFGAGLVNCMLMRLAPDRTPPRGHPAHGKGLVDGKPAAYVCTAGVCGLPVTDAAALTREINPGSAGR